MTTPHDEDRERDELAVAERTYESVVADQAATPEQRQAAAAAMVAEASDVSPAEAEAAREYAAAAEAERWHDDLAEIRRGAEFDDAYIEQQRQREVELDRDRAREQHR